MWCLTANAEVHFPQRTPVLLARWRAPIHSKKRVTVPPEVLQAGSGAATRRSPATRRRVRCGGGRGQNGSSPLVPAATLDTPERRYCYCGGGDGGSLTSNAGTLPLDSLFTDGSTEAEWSRAYLSLLQVLSWAFCGHELNESALLGPVGSSAFCG